MKPLEPLAEGSGRSIVSATVANALIDGANQINALRGDGSGVKVTHSDSNIVIDAGCPAPRLFTYSQDVTYYRTPPSLYCVLPAGPSGGVATPATYTDSNTVGAEFYWNLYSYFPDRLFWDGVCPILPRTPGAVSTFPQTRSAGNKWGDHPDLTPLTIGPFNKRMIIFGATDIYVDDRLYVSIDGGTETRIGTGEQAVTKNNPIAYLPKGSTMRFRVLEIGGAYCWAIGYVGAKAVHCCPKLWREQLGI